MISPLRYRPERFLFLKMDIWFFVAASFPG